MKKDLRKQLLILIALLLGNMVLLLCCLSVISIVLFQLNGVTLNNNTKTNEIEIEEESQVTIQNGIIIDGYENWLKFLRLSSAGEDCFVEIVHKLDTNILSTDVLHSSLLTTNRKIYYEDGRYKIEKIVCQPTNFNGGGNIAEDTGTTDEFLYLKMEYIDDSYYWLFTNQESLTMQQITEAVITSIGKEVADDVTISYFDKNGQIKIFIRGWGQAIERDSTELSDKTLYLGATMYYSYTYSIGDSIGDSQGKYGDIFNCDAFSFATDVRHTIKSQLLLQNLFLDEVIYPASDAIQDKCIVIEDGVLTGGADVGLEFYLRTLMQKRAEVRILCYNQGEITEAMDVIYNSMKNIYEVSLLTEENEVQKEEYSYLKLFSDGYVLTNKESLTEEEWKENFSKDLPGGVRTVLRRECR